MIVRVPFMASGPPTPKALRHPAQGCARHERYPGNRHPNPMNPGRTATRFRPLSARMDGTPLGFALEKGMDGFDDPGLFQPWAGRRNPLGIQNRDTKGATA